MKPNFEFTEKTIVNIISVCNICGFALWLALFITGIVAMFSNPLHILTAGVSVVFADYFLEGRCKDKTLREVIKAKFGINI